MVSGKEYVGQTTLSIEARWKSHVKTSKYSNKNFAISNAIRKYGIHNFSIEQIDTAHSRKELNEKEILWIAHRNNLSTLLRKKINYLTSKLDGTRLQFRFVEKELCNPLS
jgi:group I intron endonuclease